MHIVQAIFTGSYSWLLWSFVVAFVVATFGLNVGVSFYDHRVFSHGAITIINPKLRWFARYIAWQMTWMEPREWAYVHRKHHRDPDGYTDPYSPNSPGNRGAHVWRIILWDGPIYHKEKHKPDIMDGTYAEPWDPPVDAWDRLFRKTHFGAIVMGLIYLLAFGLVYRSSIAFAAALVTLTLHILMVVIGAGLVNALNHDPKWLREGAKWRTNPVRNRTTGLTWNRRWLALITAGEGWHNEHHEHQRSARFGPYNDPTARMSEIFKGLGWVSLNQDHDPHATIRARRARKGLPFIEVFEDEPANASNRVLV